MSAASAKSPRSGLFQAKPACAPAGLGKGGGERVAEVLRDGTQLLDIFGISTDKPRLGVGGGQMRCGREVLGFDKQEKAGGELFSLT